jgi:peroxiredoxin
MREDNHHEWQGRTIVITRNSLILALGLAIIAVVGGCAKGTTRQAGVAASPTDVQPVLVGTQVPNVALKDTSGKEVELGSLLARKPTILVVYRGNWCVYCQKQLADLQQVEPQLLALGYQIVAVSPDSPADLRKGVIGQTVKYQLLSDGSLSAATSLGLAYYVDERTRMQMESFGVTARNVSAQPEWMLPVPAVFIVGTDRQIRWEFVTPDYRERAPIDLLLAAAKIYAKP